MHGDFSRLTFDPRNRFSRVLVQQGRVYLDSDENERTAIQVHALRGVMRDLVGPHGIPDTAEVTTGFSIAKGDAATPGFKIGLGRYYVNGILCENSDELAGYFNQPDYFVDAGDDPLPDMPYLIYLDVWERHSTFVDHPLLRETALGGPDTASRAQVVWQVRVLKPDAGFPSPANPQTITSEYIAKEVEQRGPTQRPRMRARVKPGDVSTTPCVMPPGNGYRGRENQLYRIEVHGGGPAGTATLKWSRDNGSVTFPVSAIGADGVTVDNLGLDATRTLVPGDWVELLDDLVVLHGRPGMLARVISVDESRRVALDPLGPVSIPDSLDQARRPFLRRWDHRGAPPAAGTVTIKESADPDAGWIDIEDRIQVQFEPLADIAQYVTGDYWTIPARTATGGIEWPATGGVPDALPPQGIEHSYAPLAMMKATIAGFRRIVNMAVTVGV
jgi:hypothetical protein